MAENLIGSSRVKPTEETPPQSMRLAFVGKGGAGKSFTCGTLARIFARRGHGVLALDLDTLPGLAFSLGLPLEMAGESSLPEEVTERIPEEGLKLREGIRVEDLVKTYAVNGPDKVRFLQLGKLPGKVKPGSTTAFRMILEDFREENCTMIADLAAGTRQPFFGWGDFAELILVVVEPSAKSILSARRLVRLGLTSPPQAGEEPDKKPEIRPWIGLVANKVRGPADQEIIRQGLAGYLKEGEFPLLGAIPEDEKVRLAEQKGSAPLDLVPEAPGVQAVQELAIKLEKLIGERRKALPAERKIK